MKRKAAVQKPAPVPQAEPVEEPLPQAAEVIEFPRPLAWHELEDLTLPAVLVMTVNHHNETHHYGARLVVDRSHMRGKGKEAIKVVRYDGVYFEPLGYQSIAQHELILTVNERDQICMGPHPVAVRFPTERERATIERHARQANAPKPKTDKPIAAPKPNRILGPKQRSLGQEPNTPEVPRQKRGGKGDTAIALIRRPGGVSLGELMDAMGWLMHTTRAFVSVAARRYGIRVESVRGATDRERIYREYQEGAGNPSTGLKTASKPASEPSLEATQGPKPRPGRVDGPKVVGSLPQAEKSAPKPPQGVRRRQHPTPATRKGDSSKPRKR